MTTDHTHPSDYAPGLSALVQHLAAGRLRTARQRALLQVARPDERNPRYREGLLTWLSRHHP